MSKRSKAVPMPYPEPLPQAPVDGRLPHHLRDFERDTFAQNRGFRSHDDYQSSRWEPTSQPQPHVSPAVQGHVETRHLPGHVAKEK